jgi:hypothetical protein
MTIKKRWFVIGTVAILTIVGLPFTQREAAPVQAEPVIEQEPIEITVANLFVNSGLKMNCYEFKVIWEKLFPDKECRRFKTNIGTMHWECNVKEEIWIDANWDLKGSIRIYTK